MHSLIFEVHQICQYFMKVSMKSAGRKGLLFHLVRGTDFDLIWIVHVNIKKRSLNVVWEFWNGDKLPPSVLERKSWWQWRLIVDYSCKKTLFNIMNVLWVFINLVKDRWVSGSRLNVYLCIDIVYSYNCTFMVENAGRTEKILLVENSFGNFSILILDKVNIRVYIYMHVVLTFIKFV